MNNEIDKVLLSNPNLKLMLHVVAGYPDFETNIKLIKLMSDCGIDLIEIQIPFSDPLADGPSIMKANQEALVKGTQTVDCYNLIKQIKDITDIPLLFMSYANIPFSIGMERFISKCTSIGISGLIIPDLPFDEDNDEYISIANKYNVHPIQVISPDIDLKRLKTMTSKLSGFIYTTLKIGITGSRKKIEQNGIDFLDILKKNTSMPIAAGFGISSPKHIKQLVGKSDIAVIGSHIINIMGKDGLRGVEKFINQCKEIIS